MSGTKEKATVKQSAKGRAGKVSAQEVAQADASDLPGAERSVTLPGHYVAVGASPVSLKPGDAGAPPSSDDVITLTGDNVSISAPAVHISADHLNTVQRELMNVVLAADGQDSAVTPTVPATDDVVVLEVRARHERGFWRCGRFWPREPVHVFVSDDPDGDNEANALEGDVVVESFISHETAERLKAEPHLVVTVLQTVAGKG
ncbi:hypothetical protein R8555_05300 [Klebsiella pneumoniae]|uniref:hypothetical protein n=1 Tax=Klebsiella TaxID=570 RepID=UPI000B2F677D|nr:MULTISPECIES: hypothetical protein [Klebsiella]GJK94162.1 hypothetical protein TUM17568_53680 [Klebsiella oxytoca]MCT4362983.1 hypothetical protein [Klebsiella pneumoniae]MDH0814597.1 hypothetical protein [Klebsiella grimontii]MDH2044687.1 hypothetical protein [Klebsiella grimontii]MDK3048840.1 hypothetical protein [Klebsiella michiganensis]